MPVETVPTSGASTARAIRKARARRIVVRLAIGVVLPTMLWSVYLGAVATPEYESISAFTIQSSDSGNAGGVALLLGSLAGSTSAHDVLVVREYILSRDMLALLERDEHILGHFRDPAADWWSRLSAGTSSEESFKHYLSHVDAELDAQSSVLTLCVRAYSAADAERFARAILAGSEAMVNKLSEKTRADRVLLAESELRSTEERLTKARRALLEAQRSGEELNPQASAGAVMTIRGELEGQVAAARAELSALLSRMQPDAPQVVAQRARVSALAGQVEYQRRRLAGDQGEGLNVSIAEFEPLAIEKEFAQKAYESSLASLEIARVDAFRQHRYLVQIAAPSSPDRATHPRFWRSLLTVFLASFLLLGIGTMVVAALREHSQV